MSRQGKIARLPLAIREELNRRLLEGRSGAKILPWLNALPEVIAILEDDFEGLKVRDQNLSEWRKGGYQDWLKRRERVDTTRELAKFAAELSAAKGATLTEGAAAIAAGKILEVLEGSADSPVDPESFAAVVAALARLREGDHSFEKIRQADIKLGQAAQMLALEQQKFQRDTAEMFIQWQANQKARDIAGADAPHEKKIELLGRLMFGELWRDPAPKS